jgi:hypothetical protein
MTAQSTGDIIAKQQLNTEDLLNQANGFLADLLTVTNVAFSDGFNIDNLIPDSYNYASVPSVWLPVFAGEIRPTLHTDDVTGPPQAPVFNFTDFTPVPWPTDDLLVPSNTFTFYEQLYSSTLLDATKAKLLDDILNGSYGIDPTDEIALLNRARDREVELAMTRIDQAGRDLAARGFPLPPGELAIQIDRAWQDMQNKVSDASRDITLDRSKRYVDARQFSIVQSRELEQILIGAHLSVQERALNTAKAAMEFSIAVYNTVVERFKARLQYATSVVDTEFKQSQAESERAKTFVANYQGQIAAYEANLRRLIEASRLQVELYRGDVEANRAYNEALNARANLQVKVLESTVQQNIQISNLAIENAKAKLLATVEGLKFRVEANKFTGANYFALLTAMTSTVNTLASQTATA